MLWSGRLGGAVDGGAGVVVGAVGSGPGGGSVGCHRQRPAAFVNGVVVCFTHGGEVVDVGLATALPRIHMMDSAGVEGDGAVGMDTGAVHRS